MSFGWSAGDIVAALQATHSLYDALDGYKGVSEEYREAVSFLRSLTRTLEPLSTLTAWSAYPAYGEEIKQQVALIREPVCVFLRDVIKFEPSLGEKARKGRRRGIVRKLQWYLDTSRDVLDSWLSRRRSRAI